VLTLEDRIVARVQAADYRDWRDKVTAIGGCAAPIRLMGAWQVHDQLSGTVLAHHGGNVFVPCGNRRASVCPSCSDRYAADAYHLMHAGLAGGSKGVPVTVAEKPRVFATLTAPSFSPVHNRPTTANGKARPCTGCGDWHHPEDPRIGGPVDPDTYDYVGAILWQAHAGKLWHRFTITLRRLLAHAAGLTVREFADHARLSYAKVAEYQRRGLVHFHAVLRVDGPDGPTDTTPHWVTSELLEHCVTAAARQVKITTTRPDGSLLELHWVRRSTTGRSARPTQIKSRTSPGRSPNTGWPPTWPSTPPRAPARPTAPTGPSAPSCASTSCGSPSTTAA
jgi:hypothetical protein